MKERRLLASCHINGSFPEGGPSYDASMRAFFAFTRELASECPGLTTEDFLIRVDSWTPEAGLETGRRHRDAVLACHNAGRILAESDLPKILSEIREAETVGPLVDPTLYREKGKAMAQDKEILEAALPLWRIAQKAKGHYTEDAR